MVVFLCLGTMALISSYSSIGYAIRLRQKLSLKGTLVITRPHLVTTGYRLGAFTYHILRSA